MKIGKLFSKVAQFEKRRRFRSSLVARQSLAGRPSENHRASSDLGDPLISPVLSLLNSSLNQFGEAFDSIQSGGYSHPFSVGGLDADY